MNPKLLTKPFASEGLRNSIAEDVTETTPANAATYTKGFPAVTMTPIAVGGQPPSGKDMNGILYELSSHIAYINKGGSYKFDADFCEEIGGYDIGCVLQSDDSLSLYVNTLPNNKTNPNTNNSRGWKVIASSSIADDLDKKLIKKVSIISSISELRKFAGNGVAFVRGYHEDGLSFGGGLFISADTDKSSTDNASTIIVSTNGTRWKRVFSGAMSLYDFGYLASNNNAQEAVNIAESAALGVFVDCLGLTVDMGTKYPTQNKYTNGKFTIGGKTVDMQYQPIRSGIGRFITGSGAAENLKSNEWTGASLVAIGEYALNKVEKCVSTIAIGKRALGQAKISRDNIAIGPDSLFATQSASEWYDQSKMEGTRNIGIGGNAGRGITTGYANVAVGRNAGQGLDTGYSNVAIGSGALGGTAPVGLTGDIEVFWPSKTSKTVAIGQSVLAQYQNKEAQVVIGGDAAKHAKAVAKTTVIGSAAMENLEQNRAPNGGDVVWSGTESGTYTQSGNTITLTFSNLRGAKATYWVGIRLTSGAAQTLQGDVVPVEVVSAADTTITVNSPKSLNTSGSAELKFVYSATSSAAENKELTIIGANAMNSALTAGHSTIIGADAAVSGTDYQKSTAVGASAMRKGTHVSSVAVGFWSAPNISSEECVFVGDSAGYRDVQGNVLSGKISNSIAIGFNARVNGNNEIQIGKQGQTLYAPTNVNIRSDRRDKTDIKPLSDGLKFVMKLKPVTGYYDRRDAYVDELFKDLPEDERAAKVREWWKNPTKDGRHKDDRLRHWFIAQDIAALEAEYGQLPMVNLKNDTYTIEYETFIPVLTKAIQELTEKVEALERKSK